MDTFELHFSENQVGKDIIIHNSSVWLFEDICLLLTITTFWFCKGFLLHLFQHKLEVFFTTCLYSGEKLLLCTKGILSTIN